MLLQLFDSWLCHAHTILNNGYFRIWNWDYSRCYLIRKNIIANTRSQSRINLSILSVPSFHYYSPIITYVHESVFFPIHLLCWWVDQRKQCNNDSYSSPRLIDANLILHIEHLFPLAIWNFIISRRRLSDPVYRHFKLHFSIGCHRRRMHLRKHHYYYWIKGQWKYRTLKNAWNISMFLFRLRSIESNPEYIGLRMKNINRRYIRYIVWPLIMFLFTNMGVNLCGKFSENETRQPRNVGEKN